MKLVTLTTPTEKGTITKPTVTGVTVDDLPVAVIGDQASHPLGPDPLVEGIPGITIDGLPIAFSTSKTSRKATVMETVNIPITGSSLSVGCVKAPRLVDQGKQVEECWNDAMHSDYPLQQLYNFARKDSEVVFIHLLMDIFGSDIPYKAYQKLFHDACDKKLKMPKIIVVNNPINGKAQLAFNRRNQKIYVNKLFLQKAIRDNETRFWLLLALVEEFGHYLDWLLRNEYSKGTKKGPKEDAEGDEGARYSYYLFYIDLMNTSEVHFADAAVDGESYSLNYEYKELHEKLVKQQKDRGEKEDQEGDWEYFGAGDPNIESPSKFGHASIERIALSGILNDTTAIDKIYFGNWMRDFSQLVDPMIIRPLSLVTGGAAEKASEAYKGGKRSGVWSESTKKLFDEYMRNPEKLKNTNPPEEVKDVPLVDDYSINLNPFSDEALVELHYKTDTFYPIKFSHETVISLLKILAAKEFVANKYKHVQANEPENYEAYLQALKDKYAELTAELVGAYRPEEHIDNPRALQPDPKDPRPKDLNFELNKHMGFGQDETKGFVKDPIEKQFDIDDRYAMKKYMRSEKDWKAEGFPFPTSYEYMMGMFEKSASAQGNLRYIYFGAGLHVLEDFFAHTNFCEIALVKIGNLKVFPWVEVENFLEIRQGRWNITNNNKLPKPTADERPDQEYHAYTEGIDGLGKSGKKKNGKDEYKFYGLAAYYPLVTGSFGLLDTMASVLPKLNEHMFSLEVKPMEEHKYKERTLTDMVILEGLRNLSKAQGSHKTAGAYNGKADDSYASWYMAYLAARDEYVYDYVGSLSLSDVFFPAKYLSYLIDNYIRIARNFLKHTLISITASLIDDYQTAVNMQLTDIENGTYRLGTDPTHTQVAKDDFDSPLHTLASKLAVDAVREVGSMMKAVWDGTGSIEDLKKVVDKIFCHPVYSDWADQRIHQWISQKDDKGKEINKPKLKELEDPSIILKSFLKGVEEAEEVYKVLKKTNADLIVSAQEPGFSMEKTWEKIQERNAYLRQKIAAIEAKYSAPAPPEPAKKQAPRNNVVIGEPHPVKK